MEFNDYLQKAKKLNSKKVPFRFQLSIDLKDDFQKLCKENNVTMTDMLITFIETSINESKKVK